MISTALAGVQNSKLNRTRSYKMSRMNGTWRSGSWTRNRGHFPRFLSLTGEHRFLSWVCISPGDDPERRGHSLMLTLGIPLQPLDYL